MLRGWKLFLFAKLILSCVYLLRNLNWFYLRLLNSQPKLQYKYFKFNFGTGANDVRDAAQLLVELLQSSNNVSLQSVSDAPRARITTTQVLLERNHGTQLDARQLMLLAAWNYTIGNSSEPYPSLNVIHKVGDTATAAADSRGGGSPASF